MTISIEVAAEVRRLYFGEHWKRGTIAGHLGLHHDTVSRVLGSFGPKQGTPRPDARVLEPYLGNRCTKGRSSARPSGCASFGA